MLVLIPSAGVGSRLDYHTQHFNKAMIQIGDLPIISHIVEAYPQNTKFIIMLGYKGDHIKQYLNLTYGNKKFIFIEVKNFNGLGSGLTLTLKKALPLIDRPFFFHANDTIVKDKNFYKNIKRNTMFLHNGPADSMRFATVELKKQINHKLNHYIKNCYNYTGLAYVKDYQLFKKIIKDSHNNFGELSYFKNIQFNNIDFKFVKYWHDIGSHDTKTLAEKTFRKRNILPKSDQGIFFKNNKVIKFFINPKTIIKRYKRSIILKDFVPKILNKKSFFYVYKFERGTIFSKLTNKKLEFKKLLDYLNKSFWIKKKLNKTKKYLFDKLCYNFYYEKTQTRINVLYEKNNVRDEKNIINNIQLPSLDNLLKKIDWKKINDGVPSNFHGDLHFENIIFNRVRRKYTLLDWRDDFSGILDYGDLYYDLAKLNHGLIIDHNIVSEEKYNIQINKNNINLDFYFSKDNSNCQKILTNFLIKQKLSIYKINILTALIFLNIAGLHHYPYSIFLYYLGKAHLNESLKRENSKKIICIKKKK